MSGAGRVVYMKLSAQADSDLAGAFRSHRAELVRLAAFILGSRHAARHAPTQGRHASPFGISGF
jgi:hypothetical protein